MPDRAYLSIGEVLELLRVEFPDITISKIRFLESQGLLEPERTASGYRKFYDVDVERLRFILRQQREKYLPLKVIRDQLELAPPAPEPAAEPRPEQPAAADPPAVAVRSRPEPAAPRAAASTRTAAGANNGPSPSPSPSPAAGARAGHDSAASPREAARALLAGVGSGISLTFDELVAASGLSADDVHQLESFGLVSGHPVFSATYYDEEALLVAKLAAGFRRYGVEPRHLRMYKTAADREAAFLEQVVTPLVRRRTPETRHQALDAIAELVRLGEQLRAVALRRVLRSAVDRG